MPAPMLHKNNSKSLGPPENGSTKLSHFYSIFMLNLIYCS